MLPRTPFAWLLDLVWPPMPHVHKFKFSYFRHWSDSNCDMTFTWVFCQWECQHCSMRIESGHAYEPDITDDEYDRIYKLGPLTYDEVMKFDDDWPFAFRNLHP